MTVASSSTASQRPRLSEFARRGGSISAGIGIGLSLIVAGALMHRALLEGADRHRGDLGALLMSSCQAAVALDAPDLVQETLDELSPRLADLVYVRVRDGDHRVIAHWGADSAQRAIRRGSTPVLDSEASIIGFIDLGVSTARADEALGRMWKYLGLIGLFSLTLSTVASMFVGRAMTEKTRLEGELELAERVQTAILPRQLVLAGYELAARMLPASEVGGDYYDVISTDDGGWICVGDVAGHGLPAGLVMVMMQSGLATLLRHEPNLDPASAVRVLNQVVYDNTARMGDARHASLSIARCRRDGSVVCAGGHLDPIIARAAGGIETVESPGPYIGLERELERQAIDTTRFQLAPGDVLLLYTDGVTEARNAAGEMFGIERLRAALDAARERSPAQAVEHIFAVVGAWAAEQRDDISVLVARRIAGSDP
jgi:hypothetical protein